MVKSKLPPRSGSSLEAVEPYPERGAIKFFFLNKLIKATITRVMKQLTETFIPCQRVIPVYQILQDGLNFFI